MYFTIDRFWDILSAISSDEETAAEGDALTDVLDSIALDAQAKAGLYFDVAMGGYPPSREDDWVRLRTFLLDWYSAHQTISSATSQITDPRTLSNPDLDELFRSFGYPYSTQLRGPDDNPIDAKINFFLDLVNLYKRKGTPQSIVEVLQYYGVTKLNIYEFFIQRESAASLEFEGKAVAGTELNPSDLLFEYDRLTEGDPHWLYTESQILSLYDQNDINLPSKTPYLGVQPVASIDGAEIGILVRIVQDQYEYYLTNGVLPTANAEISETGEVVTLLELYLSIIYVFQKQFNVGQVGDSFICYDGTSDVLTEVTEIIDEFETITAKPTTRAEILTGLEEFYDQFTRETPRNFLQNRSDAETILTAINPTLKDDLDNTTLTNAELLFSLVKDLSNWVRINLGYGFVNMGFIMFGLDSFFEDLKPVINFFKPYRARLLLLELLQIDNPLFNTIIVEDFVDPVNVEFPIHDFVTGDGNPCCTLIDIDTTDCCTVCLEDSTASLFYARDTYDCDSYHDLGAVTDILQNDFFPEIHEIRSVSLVCVPPDFDSTSIVMNEVLYGSMSAVFDGTAWSTVIDTTGVISTGDKMYEELSTGGFADFDEPGVYDCPTGFDECFVQVYNESSSSSSSSTSSSSLSSSSASEPSCAPDCSDPFDSTGELDVAFWIGGTDAFQQEDGQAVFRIRWPLPTWSWIGDVQTRFRFTGDFDVTMDVDIRNVNNDNSKTSGGWCNMWGTQSSTYLGFWMGDQQDNGTPGYQLNGIQWWADDGDDYYAIDTGDVGSHVGGLRLLRTGTNLYGFYWKDGIWQWNDSTAGILLDTSSTENMDIYLENYVSHPDGRDHSPIVRLDNFCTAEGCDSKFWWA